ncbi:MAG: substrate-binding domain-containing protein [Alphaproteobacteria bacterium]|nr:substrate-binding domain-containing protein [Alphaproteobacteria bacterium]
MSTSERASPGPEGGTAATARHAVTAAEVARQAGVSQSAVSRTYTPGASVSSRTREKVLTAARALGYRPNAMARSLITNRSRIIGVVMAYLDNLIYPDVVEKLAARLQQRGYQMLLFTGFKDRHSDPVFEQVMQYRVDGLLLASTTLSSDLADECAAAGVPVVMFNRMTEHPLCSSVTSDNRNGGRQIAEFLVAGGHRRFAYVAGAAISSTNRDREAGFREGLLRHGIAEIGYAEGNLELADSRDAARSLFAADRPPDAVFVGSDHMALAVMEVARHEFALRVPEDVSIVGYDDVGAADWPSFSLTSFSLPIAPMVDAAVALMMEQIESSSVLSHHRVVPGRLAVRGSARLPREPVRDRDGMLIWAPAGLE